MTEKLEIVQIEESEEESQVMKLSETYWKDYLRDNEYNKDPNKMCELCIEEQIKKHGQQVIPCTGINRAENKLGKHLFDQIVDTLTPEEKAELDALYDPYVYMDTFLDIGKPKQLEDRWYQKIISACLHGDSLVSMSDGSYKKIKDIKIGDKVVSYNETKRSLPINKVTNVWNQGIKPVYRVTLENGDYLDCTRDHPILSHFKSGKENKLLNCPSYETTYKSLEDGLDVGMDVYTVNKSERWGKFSNTDVAKLLGYLITDGYINLLPDTKEKRNRRTVQFANIREEYSLEFKRICEEVFDCQVTYVVKESYIHKTTGVNRKKTYWCYVNKREKLDNFLKSIGCVDKTTREMSIFNFALNNFNEECTKYFLNRAYAGDGSLYLGKNNSIKICLHGSYKSELINNWHKILRKIGCWKSIVNNRIRNDGSSSLSLISTAISAKALLNFTGPIFGKETQSKKILSRISELDLSKRSLKRGSFNTSTRTKIVSIEYIGEHTTYDIEVENRHNFVANNIIVHNCSAQSKVIRVGRRSGKTYMMALMMVHEMLVNDKYRVLVVSPYAVQTGEVIKTFLDLCSRLPDNPVKSSKQTPVWEINFHNGSVLMGFTAATNADSVRGQTANRIVLDECLVGETNITMSDGSVKEIKDIIVGDYVYSNEGTIDKVINSKSTGIKDTYEYKFDNGTTLRCTENHPVKDIYSFVPIAKAEYVKVPMKERYLKNKDEILSRLLGYNHGDGWLSKGTVGFAGDVLGLKEIIKDINYLFPDKWKMTINSRKTTSPKYNIVGTTNSFTVGKELHDIFISHGFIDVGKKVNTKVNVPDFILNGSLNNKAEYLAGLFGAEGAKPIFPRNKGFLPKTITLSQHKDKENIPNLIIYMNTLVSLLKDLGIDSYINEPKISLSGTYKCVLSINNNISNLIKFFEKVGYRYCSYKDKLSHKTLQYLYYLNNLKNTRKELVNRVKEYKKTHTYSEVVDYFNISLEEAKEYNLSSKSAFIRKGCLKFNDWCSLHSFNDDVYTLKIGEKYLGEQEVYNLTVDNSHTYIANGLLTHNCDDIPEAAIVSVMAIKMSVPDVKVWRSGTPKGERNLNRAEQDPMNKCFHYPSYVIPHYDDKMDASLRHEMGDGIGYVQEVMAIIGVANDQVFQSMFLNRAQNKLKFVTALDVIADRSRYIVTIGVDWNHDKVGTRIIVLAYDKIEPQFYIIDKEIVAIEGKTQHAAQDKIIRLNRKYNCEHIFVDKGFGTTQIANIKQFALAQVGTIPKGHPDLKLLDMLAIDYGSSTEVQDPVTGEIVKHPTKQMAVMNAVEVLEKDLLALHPKDDHDIIKQFKNYVEKSRNKGKITYGYLSAKVGDHDLDAIMIALFGMKKTYSSIFISESTQALIKFVDKNDENREESDFDEVTNMLFGISFGRKSQNNKRTENLRSNRSGGFNRRDRGRF